MSNIKYLHRCPCRLVQSAEFKDNITEITGRDSIIELNYMGSSEFEWGALPKSTTRMLINIDFYDVYTFPQYVDKNGDELKVYAPKMFIEHISKIVEQLANGSLNYRLQEWCNLSQYLAGEELYLNYADFWWDIENDFYIFFGDKNEKLVLEAQNKLRKISINDVEIGDWDELSQYYLKFNQDLNDDAIEFLKQKKSYTSKRLVKRFK